MSATWASLVGKAGAGSSCVGAGAGAADAGVATKAAPSAAAASALLASAAAPREGNAFFDELANTSQDGFNLTFKQMLTGMGKKKMAKQNEQRVQNDDDDDDMEASPSLARAQARITAASAMASSRGHGGRGTKRVSAGISTSPLPPGVKVRKVFRRGTGRTPAEDKKRRKVMRSDVVEGAPPKAKAKAMAQPAAAAAAAAAAKSLAPSSPWAAVVRGSLDVRMEGQDTVSEGANEDDGGKDDSFVVVETDSSSSSSSSSSSVSKRLSWVDAAGESEDAAATEIATPTDAKDGDVAMQEGGEEEATIAIAAAAAPASPARQRASSTSWADELDDGLGDVPSPVKKAKPSKSSRTKTKTEEVGERKAATAVKAARFHRETALPARLTASDRKPAVNGNRSGNASEGEGEDSSEVVTVKRELQPLTAARIEKRQRQIDLGKATVGYRRYRDLVPIAKRDGTGLTAQGHNTASARHPVTPDKSARMSKRSWDGVVRVWRRALHRWDPTPASAASEEEQEQEQKGKKESEKDDEKVEGVTGAQEDSESSAANTIVNGNEKGEGDGEGGRNQQQQRRKSSRSNTKSYIKGKGKSKSKRVAAVKERKGSAFAASSLDDADAFPSLGSQ